MARILRNEQMGPYRIDPADFPKDGKAIWVCGCGLSASMPYCDKAHNICRQVEQPGRLYTYDAKTRQVVKDEPDAGPA